MLFVKVPRDEGTIKKIISYFAKRKILSLVKSGNEKRKHGIMAPIHM